MAALALASPVLSLPPSLLGSVKPRPRETRCSPGARDGAEARHLPRLGARVAERAGVSTHDLLRSLQADSRVGGIRGGWEESEGGAGQPIYGHLSETARDAMAACGWSAHLFPLQQPSHKQSDQFGHSEGKC